MFHLSVLASELLVLWESASPLLLFLVSLVGGKPSLVVVVLVMFGGGVIACPVMMSNICLSYLSGLGMRLIVLALTTLLPMSRSVSPFDVFLPSQIALKKRCSIFGSCLKVGSRYCVVSPNSQIGAVWSLFHLRK